ncbi:MAG: hypothetical protein ACYTGG_14630 [Planctomycetota bacterium]|jgi:hypothetical protein
MRSVWCTSPDASWATEERKKNRASAAQIAKNTTARISQKVRFRYAALCPISSS